VQARLAALQNDAATGQLADLSSLTVAGWLDMAKGRVQPKTHLRYEQLVRRRVNRTSAASNWRSWSRSTSNKCSPPSPEPASRQAVSRWPGRCSKALRDAVKLRLIRTNPAADVEKPKPGKARVRVYDEAQARALLAAATGHCLYALLIVALATRMRQGELFTLPWQDADIQADSVHV
jgi:integrase